MLLLLLHNLVCQGPQMLQHSSVSELDNVQSLLQSCLPSGIDLIEQSFLRKNNEPGRTLATLLPQLIRTSQ